jgi:glycosyltransferase involved in cell wall biosynthesis
LDQAQNALAALIRRHNPDVVLANTLETFLAILAAKKTGIPSVWNLRESAAWDTCFSYLPDPVAQCAIAAICLPDRVVFVSQASRRVWDRFDPYGHFEVIHTGIDPARFPARSKATAKEKARRSLEVQDGVHMILCVGTLSARKAQRDLVEALALLPQSVREHVQLFLVGDDRNPYARKLKRRCRTLAADLRARIRFAPATAAMQPFYEAADIFVLCSVEESFPRVILEAMSFGLPIITTPAYGVTEQCLEGVNALFYPHGDQAALAEKIAFLIAQASLREQMGRSSLQLLSKLNTFEEMIGGYTAILRQAAGKKDQALKTA